MWRMANFCGVKLLTYCVMDNHVHMLVRVPSQQAFLRRFEDRVVLDVVAIPEPSTTALLGLGGLALILRRRK